MGRRGSVRVVFARERWHGVLELTCETIVYRGTPGFR
jgi:hypothetical protein